jgi:hypothetical protein
VQPQKLNEIPIKNLTKRKYTMGVSP